MIAFLQLVPVRLFGTGQIMSILNTNPISIKVNVATSPADPDEEPDAELALSATPQRTSVTFFDID
ncbi:hypothetical protein TSUD_234800 [Trifolium subterraneum]|uniref:Uncharacterized protein n=1 Tax=Trifolium subterraneum TaxID=3900 RepID=A0A2Z6LWQ3_TRISU|nr:hypothetical protein TSUD_234800 [Trifolium subterraneum]